MIQWFLSSSWNMEEEAKNSDTIFKLWILYKHIFTWVLMLLFGCCSCIIYPDNLLIFFSNLTFHTFFLLIFIFMIVIMMMLILYGFFILFFSSQFHSFFIICFIDTQNDNMGEKKEKSKIIITIMVMTVIRW